MLKRSKRDYQYSCLFSAIYKFLLLPITELYIVQCLEPKLIPFLVNPLLGWCLQTKINWKKQIERTTLLIALQQTTPFQIL